MTETIPFPSDNPSGITQFTRCDHALRLSRLCGMSIGRNGEDTGPVQARGVALLQLDGRRYEGDELALETVEEIANGLTCHWRIGQTSVLLTTRWQGCPHTGIISRRDTLTNSGDTPVTLSRCLARVTFPPARYECFTQASRWCHENQGAWQALHAGLTLHHAWGRTTEGHTPYLVLRTLDAEQGIAFHILPRGNWTLRVQPVTEGGELPFAVVELGLADENLQRVLAPGESFALPEILFQPLPRGVPQLGAPALHRYLLAHHFAGAKPDAPVVYNTWFDQFEILEVPRLREQLAAAREVGCEIFVIDAGWYGAGGPNWWAQAGDWREKTEAAFHGQMRAFADEVRAAGLGFGLWMEPERFAALAPIRAEHPEWFIPSGEAARIDLTQPPAYAYLRGEIGRLVETYALAWMKIDFNFTLDADASGAELADYTEVWYRLLDEIRRAYPDTFFEGCASGAMRGDLALLSHVDGHFLSDTVNPVDMLRISQGAWLRLPPAGSHAGRCCARRVRCCRVMARTWPNPRPRCLPPAARCGSRRKLWISISFCSPPCRACSASGGDLAGLPKADRKVLRQASAFYKNWRRFITSSVAHLLTPPELLDHREGWIGVQLQAPGDDASLVFVYRLGVCGAPPRLTLQALQSEACYTILRGFTEEKKDRQLTGHTLMSDGLPLTGLFAGIGHRAEVFVVRRSSV